MKRNGRMILKLFLDRQVVGMMTEFTTLRIRIAASCEEGSDGAVCVPRDSASSSQFCSERTSRCVSVVYSKETFGKHV